MNIKNYKTGKSINTSSLADVESDESIQTLDIEAEEVEEDSGLVRRKAPRNFNGSNKRVGTFPWKEMLSFYVRGERVIKGGLRHTTTPTYRDVAERFGCAYNTVCMHAKADNWVEKRDIYRSKLSNEFSFYGQMAADINGEVLNTASAMIQKIKRKVLDPTFIPEPSDVIKQGKKSYVLCPDTGELIQLPEHGKNPSSQPETKTILDLVKALETINKICNSTVQVEIDNANLLESENNRLNDGEEQQGYRMKRVEELQKRLGQTKKSLSKKERMARVRAAKGKNKPEKLEVEVAQ